jgi:hypothetical protein
LPYPEIKKSVSCLMNPIFLGAFRPQSTSK